MLLIGTKNTNAQTLIAGDSLNLGSVYRRYCRRNSCGTPAFSASGTALTINAAGIYHVTATMVCTATVAGIVSAELAANGVAIPGAISSETITTAGTEQRTLVIDQYVLVDRACTLGTNAIQPVSLSIVNAGVGATYSAITLNAEKVA